jgi:hypothetical protein
METVPQPRGAPRRSLPGAASAIWPCGVPQPHTRFISPAGHAESRSSPRRDPFDAAGANLEQAVQGVLLAADGHDGYFTTLPTVAEGLMLRTWRTGPRAGQPKLGPAAQSLLDRGFVSLDADSRLPRLFFTETGLAALRRMMRDRRLADPEKFAHIRVELGIDPPKEADAAE